MKLSEAIAAGAAMLRTNGPGQPLGPVFVDGEQVVNDALSAAQLGLLGHPAAAGEYTMFYYDNPWGVTHGTQLEYWLRLTEAHRYRWADVISKLQAYGA